MHSNNLEERIWWLGGHEVGKKTCGFRLGIGNYDNELKPWQFQGLQGFIEDYVKNNRRRPLILQLSALFSELAVSAMLHSFQIQAGEYKMWPNTED